VSIDLIENLVQAKAVTPL